MKKLIIALVVVLGMSVQAFAGITIGVTIEFGHKDANGSCIERGFCKIGVTVGKAITANVNDSNGNLDVNFNKASLSRDVLEYHFAAGVFEVPVDYIVPADVCAKLGVEKFVVKAGKYKVVETNGILSISLPIKPVITNSTK